jgi:hypothetical protein
LLFRDCELGDLWASGACDHSALHRLRSVFTSSVRHARLWGTLFLVLGIAAFGIGFLLAIALLILLIYQRRLGAVLMVAVAACVMGGVYRLHYIPSPVKPSFPPSAVPLPTPLPFSAYLPNRPHLRPLWRGSGGRIHRYLLSGLCTHRAAHVSSCQDFA